ncbi:MAG: hypothetical protein WEB19_02330, partial [Acidimicrobiia bacterium]
PAPTAGCGPDSAYSRFADGNDVVLGGGVAVLSGFSAEGSGADCEERTLTGVDVNLLHGLVVGDDVTGTVDESKVRLTGGSVHLPAAFQLPDIDLAAAPLDLGFGPSGSGGGSNACAFPITWAAAFSSARFPFVPLPPGFTGAGAGLDISCNAARITANATAGGASFAVIADLTAAGGATATATLTDVPALGGTASGTGSITIAPGGAATYDLTATIANPELPVPGLTLDTATARLTPAGLTVAVEGSLGQASGALAVTMEGAFAPTGLSLAVDASSNSPWQVGPGLTVEAANLVGTVDVAETGAATVDLRLSVGGDWRPVPGLLVQGLSLQVANTAVPPECAIPAGGLWVRATGQGAIAIPGVAPLALAVEACLGVPTGGATPPFSLRSTIGGPQWQVAPGVVISDVGIQVSLIGDTLTLQASGGATLLGLDLTARVLFLVPTGGGQPTVVVDASGSLSGLGIPLPSGHVVFASAAVPDFEIEPGLAIDLPQGITGVGTIDLGQPIADLLNQAFSPPTPILARVTVTVSFGATIEIKAAINLGGDGATLFMGCPGGGTSCDPTAPTTTRLALTTAFIRLVVGGAGGFSIGFGGDGTLNLPPAEEDGPASPPLDLHVEASIQPPARVGLAMFFTGAWENAMGVSGLTLSNLGIQGSIDFSTTPIPTVTVGITGQVDHVPTELADVLGLTNNGEPMRFTVNVDPLAPILELTLGVDDGGIVMRPLTAVGQANALEVDFASVVIAPLGGTVGGVTYDQGISAGFGANIMGVPVHVNATVDIADAHLNGTVQVGTLTIGGVTFEDTTVLLDITPQSFQQTLCGGVHLGSTTLQGLLHIQAGSGGGGPATCGDVTLDAGGSSAGLRARFRLHAASLPVGIVDVDDFTVDATANLNALSASFNATLNVTGSISALGSDVDIDGTVAFDTTGITQLHVKAIGNLNVGPLSITGNGSCPFPAGFAPGQRSPGVPKGGRKSFAVKGQAPTSGACVQLDHAPGTGTPFRFGFKGQLKAAGSTATVEGTFGTIQTTLDGTLNVPGVGTLDIAGKLVHGTGGTIKNAEGSNVDADPGDWRVSGQFEDDTRVGGNGGNGISARWSFAAGRVPGGLFVRASASVALGGAASVNLDGFFNQNGNFSLHGESMATLPDLPINFGESAEHVALRVFVFAFPGARASNQRGCCEHTKGRLHFAASYRVSATLTQSSLSIEELQGTASVVYGERFRRASEPDGATVDSGSFHEEPSSNPARRNTLFTINISVSGADKNHPATFCAEVNGVEFGDC